MEPPEDMLLELPLQLDMSLEDKKLLLNKSQSNLEFNTFHSRKNISNMIELKELKEYLSKDKSLIIMQLKLKSNIFLNKLKKLSLNTNQFKELGKEFNIYQLKLKLFTILKEKNMLLDKDNTLRVELQL
jgi:hypothetical protein